MDEDGPDVEVGRSKHHSHEETIAFAFGDFSGLDDQIHLDDRDFAAPEPHYEDDRPTSPPPDPPNPFEFENQGDGDADGPTRFMPSSQIDLDHRSVGPGSPISFSPTPSPESQIVTPSSNRRKGDYRSQNAVTPADGSPNANGKKSHWRGAEVLARMDGEMEVEEEHRSTVRRRATTTRKNKDPEDEGEEEDEGLSEEHIKRSRKSFKRGGIVLEGVSSESAMTSS